MANLIKKICTNCKKEYEVWPYQESSKYCCKECQIEHNSEEITCEFCGKKFRRGKSAIKKFNYCSQACKWNDPEFRRRLSESIKLAALNNPRKPKEGYVSPLKGISVSPETEFKKGWQKTEWGRKLIKNRIKKIITKPNNKEQLLSNILKEAELPFEYVGNGEMIIGSKCPDYVATDGQKRLIELYGDYWHNEKNCKYWHQTEEGAKKYYSSYGYTILVIWEHELTDTDMIVDKVINFAFDEITIKNVPLQTYQLFTNFAEEKFDGKLEMAFKYLVDNLLVEDIRITQIAAILEDHEGRIAKIEGSGQKRTIKMLSGRTIELPKKE